VYEEIAVRQAEGTGGDDSTDVLGMLLDSGLSDVELRDQVVSLIAAGYDTTSAAIGWVVHAVLTTPGVWDRAKAEVEGLPERPTADEVNRLPYLDGVVSETLRLWPPGFVSGRYAVDAFDFGGHRIPGDRIVIYSAYLTHRLPELWPDPHAFDPDRWKADPVPYSFVPFGGGYRRCIGFAFATLEIKAILLQLLRRTTLAAVSPATPAPAGISSMYPKGGVPVRIAATC
jgi:cytochrome P450